jgi:hypothetical protein
MGFPEGRGRLESNTLVLRTTSHWVGWLPGALVLTGVELSFYIFDSSVVDTGGPCEPNGFETHPQSGAVLLPHLLDAFEAVRGRTVNPDDVRCKRLYELSTVLMFLVGSVPFFEPDPL